MRNTHEKINEKFMKDIYAKVPCCSAITWNPIGEIVLTNLKRNALYEINYYETTSNVDKNIPFLHTKIFIESQIKSQAK